MYNVTDFVQSKQRLIYIDKEFSYTPALLMKDTDKYEIIAANDK